MPRKLPTRPTKDISQNFNSGVVRIFAVKDVAKVGYQPKLELTQKAFARYEEQRLGINRLYLSRQNLAEIVRVVRIPRPNVSISSQDVAQTEDGQRYRVDTVQVVEGSYPPALDVSLRAVEEDFDSRLKGDGPDDVG